jgi:nitrate/nitrite-specific signal transduction histidine kinase
MVKHIVLWKLKDQAEGAPKRENAKKLKEMLEGLTKKISQIRELEVGFQLEPSEGAFDVALVSSFGSKADLEIYQKHSDHQEVVAFVKKIVSDRKVVDYEA